MTNTVINKNTALGVLEVLDQVLVVACAICLVGLVSVCGAPVRDILQNTALVSGVAGSFGLAAGACALSCALIRYAEKRMKL